MKPIIAPSLLSGDFARLAEESNRMLALGADWLHVDVMDGHFVPNLTLGAPVVKSLRPHTAGYLDCHLMVSHPEQWVADFATAGANQFTFHWEATTDAAGLISQVKARGMHVGIALKPATPITDALRTLLPQLDTVLILTVEPGFGGQSFMPGPLAKVRELRGLCPSLNIEVDGGVSEATVAAVAEAGANVLVAGSAIFGSTNPAGTIAALKQAIIIKAHRGTPLIDKN